MINLSQKAAKHFDEPFTSLESREGDFWRLDVVYINRKKMLLCVHEVTLTSYILYGREFHSIDHITSYIRERSPWYHAEVSVGKGSNRKVTGCVTDMKNLISHMKDKPIPELEAFLNRTPYTCLSTNFPDKELAQYKHNRGLSIHSE